MSIAIVLTTPSHVDDLLLWAARLAEARKCGLTLIWAQHRRGETQRSALGEGDELPEALQAATRKLIAGSFAWPETDAVEQEELPLHVVSLQADDLAAALAVEVSEQDIRSLVLPRDAGERLSALQEHLLREVACEMVVLTAGERPAEACRELLIPVGEGPHSASCLRMAYDLAASQQARLVAVHVEPEVDEVSPLAAAEMIRKIVVRVLGSQASFEPRVALGRDVATGIVQTVRDETDLIILGMKRHGLVRRYAAQGIGEKLVNLQPGPAIAVVQSALPFSSRLVHWIDEVLRGHVPQLPREQRVRLVERIQQSSRWDFDFVMLLCMSTLIAAGGLMQNAPAVVIGAMLVAPLMTPLLGTGLSLVQGNVILLQSTVLTVLRGFVVAFLISWGVGWATDATLTGEMLARGTPRVLDILVALVGGMAAAYASGRPNLLSALPGVAIAASLVPPIATSGIAVSQGDWRLGFGAALLFFTNIVAIVLGTAIAFRAVGIRGKHRHGDVRRWALAALGALLLTVFSLGIVESLPGTHAAPQLRHALESAVSSYGAHVVTIERRQLNREPGVRVVLDVPQPLPASALADVREAVFSQMSEIDAVEIDVELSAVFSRQ